MTFINKYVAILRISIGNNRVLRAFLAVLLPAYILDQMAKSIVVTVMSEYEVREVFPWLYWRYLRNSGAAFSLGESLTLIYTAVMLLVTVGIFFLIRRVNNAGWAVGMALVAAGSAGNLTDRLFRRPGWGNGYVVDFISIGNFAVFNVADMCVCSGMVLLCFLVVRGVSSGVTLQMASSVRREAALSAVSDAEESTGEVISSVSTVKNDAGRTEREAKTDKPMQVAADVPDDGQKTTDADGQKGSHDADVASETDAEDDAHGETSRGGGEGKTKPTDFKSMASKVPSKNKPSETPLLKQSGGASH